MFNEPPASNDESKEEVEAPFFENFVFLQPPSDDDDVVVDDDDDSDGYFFPENDLLAMEIMR